MKKIICASLLLCGLTIYAADYSSMSTEQLMSMRGTMQNVSEAERRIFRAEVQKRLRNMSAEEAKKYRQQRQEQKQATRKENQEARKEKRTERKVEKRLERKAQRQKIRKGQRNSNRQNNSSNK